MDAKVIDAVRVFSYRGGTKADITSVARISGSFASDAISDIIGQLFSLSSCSIDSTKPLLRFLNPEGEETFAVKGALWKREAGHKRCFLCGDTLEDYSIVGGIGRNVLKACLPLFVCEMCFRRKVCCQPKPICTGVVPFPVLPVKFEGYSPVASPPDPPSQEAVIAPPPIPVIPSLRKVFEDFGKVYPDLGIFDNEANFERLSEEWRQADPFGYNVLSEEQWKEVVQTTMEEDGGPDSLMQGMALFFLMDFENRGRVSFYNFLFLEVLEVLEGGRYQPELEERLEAVVNGKYEEAATFKLPKCLVTIP